MSRQETMVELSKILFKELRENLVTVVQWSASSCGLAFYKSRNVKIPKPTTQDRLGVGLHEIGHIVLGHCDGKGKKFRYVEEFEAEQFAINKLKQHSQYTPLYELRAINHVLSKIAQAKNRGHDVTKISEDIISWTGLNVDLWSKAKKVYVRTTQFRTVKRKEDFEILVWARGRVSTKKNR